MAEAFTLKSETILITGAAGSIGRSLALGLATSEVSHLILVDIAETAMHSLLDELTRTAPELQISFFIESIGNINFLNYLFNQFEISRIIHAAAYKHVALMEENVCSAIVTNISAAKLLIDTAEKNNVDQFILLSTDKAVSPSSLMGRTKKVVEDYIIWRNKKGSKIRLNILRLCNVYGSSGSVVPVFQDRILNNLPLVIRGEDTKRAFVQQEDLLVSISTLLNSDATGLIYIPKYYEVLKIEDLARKLLLENGKSETLYPIIFEDLLASEKQQELLIADFEQAVETPYTNLIEIKQNRDVQFDLELLDACIKHADYYHVQEAKQLLIQLTTAIV